MRETGVITSRRGNEKWEGGAFSLVRSLDDGLAVLELPAEGLVLGDAPEQAHLVT